MTSRERTIKAIEFKGPDKIPLWHGYLESFTYEPRDFLNRILADYSGHAGSYSESDNIPAQIPSPEERKTQQKRVAKDE